MLLSHWVGKELMNAILKIVFSYHYCQRHPKTSAGLWNSFRRELNRFFDSKKEKKRTQFNDKWGFTRFRPRPSFILVFLTPSPLESRVPNRRKYLCRRPFNIIGFGLVIICVSWLFIIVRDLFWWVYDEGRDKNGKTFFIWWKDYLVFWTNGIGLNMKISTIFLFCFSS